jgi:hypothetical protein
VPTVGSIYLTPLNPPVGVPSVFWELTTLIPSKKLALMLSRYLGGRTRVLHLDNATMKVVALLCHLTSIYTLLLRVYIQVPLAFSSLPGGLLLDDARVLVLKQILVSEHNLVLINANRLSQLSNPENNSIPESNSREH